MEHHRHPTPTGALIPAMSAPPGKTSNLLEHTNHLWLGNVAAQSVCMSVAGTLFFIRCFVRLGFSRMPRQWILEDWMVVASFLGLAIYSSIISHMMNNEGGVHQWDLTNDQARKVLHLFWVETIIYGPFIFCTKLSILLLYLRLLVPTRWSALWTTVHIFIAISASFYTAITLVKIWQCSPKQKAWDKDVEGHCIDLPVLLQVSGLFNTISDALILLVPIRAVWGLRLSWWKKVGVCAIFSIGAVAPVFSAIGFAARVKASPSADLTYNDIVILLWATAEITTGVICACLPTLPSLIRGPQPRKASVSTSSNGRSTTFSGRRSSAQIGEFEMMEYIQLEERRLGNSDRKRMYVEVKDGDGKEEKAPSQARDERSGGGNGAVSSVARSVIGNASRERLARDSILVADPSGTQRGIVRTVRIEQTEGR